MSNNTDISERIAQVIEYLGVSKNDFAKSLNYKRAQSIYDICNGKSAPSFDFFNRFYSSEYSVIFNHNWLMTGTGDMLSIGHKLRNMRKQLNMTLESFAYAIGEDYLVIDEIEKGIQEPSYSYIKKIQDQFNWNDDTIVNTRPIAAESSANYSNKADTEELERLSAKVEKLEKVIKELTETNQGLKEKLIESQQEVIALYKKASQIG